MYLRKTICHLQGISSRNIHEKFRLLVLYESETIDDWMFLSKSFVWSSRLKFSTKQAQILKKQLRKKLGRSFDSFWNIAVFIRQLFDWT